MAKAETAYEYALWELHAGRVDGLRRLGLAVLGLGGVLLTAEAVLTRVVKPAAGMEEVLAEAALGLVLVGAAALTALAARRKAELTRPLALGSVLLAGAVVASSLTVTVAGGVADAWPFGLLPLLFVWPAVMPGHWTTAFLPVLAAVIGFDVVCITGTQLPLPRLLVGSGVLFALVMAMTAVIEHWRRQLAGASRVDWLTGALSWRAIVAELEMMCARRSRHFRPFSLVMFDVDRFERLNDRYGRRFGDDALELLDSSVRREVRETDLLGRHHNDEFLLILDECGGQHAMEVLERIRRRLASTPLRVGDEEVRITFSAGIVTAAAAKSIDPQALLKAVDKALHGSKEAQLNQTNFSAHLAPGEASPATASAPTSAPAPAQPAPPKTAEPAAPTPPSAQAQTTATPPVSPVPPVPPVVAAVEAKPPEPKPATVEVWTFPPAPPRAAVPLPPVDDAEEAELLEGDEVVETTES